MRGASLKESSNAVLYSFIHLKRPKDACVLEHNARLHVSKLTRQKTTELG